MTTAPSHEIVTTPGASVPKLRTSCDSCGATKVKCDRGQPECGRCSTLGLACVYGISRKIGKPPRKSLVTAADSFPTPSHKKKRAWSDESCTSYGQHQGIKKQRQHEFSNLQTDILPPSSSINTMDVNEQRELDLTDFTPMPLDEWPAFELLDPGLDIFPFSKTNIFENQGSSSTLEPVNMTRGDSNSYGSHSCPRDSYEIFRDLICPSPFHHAPEGNSETVYAELDFVLHFIREAMDRLKRLLKCSCSKSGHRVMVHASIISRILIWYQQAAGLTSNNSGGSLSSASSKDTLSSSPSSSTIIGAEIPKAPSLAQSTGFIISHVPVSIGTFSIEDQNIQAAIRNQLILSELKKATGLIDLFASQDSNESFGDGLTGLNSHLGSWLRNEHSKTVTVLRMRIRSFSENIDS